MKAAGFPDALLFIGAQNTHIFLQKLLTNTYKRRIINNVRRAGNENKRPYRAFRKERLEIQKARCKSRYLRKGQGKRKRGKAQRTRLRFSKSNHQAARAEISPPPLITIQEVRAMKFKKQANVAFFSKYVREDGKFTITSVDRRVNGTLKNVFEVTDEAGTVIDTLPRLKDAKEKYAEI